MVGVDTDMNIPANPKDEFRLVFENLAGVLEAVGSSLDHVVDSTNFFAGNFARRPHHRLRQQHPREQDAVLRCQLPKGRFTQRFARNSPYPGGPLRR
jgi:enamine deaminase RidA (YjgF/YER057c/UK114 family)